MTNKVTSISIPPVNVVHCGTSEEILRMYPDNFFDSVVTDPSYGLSDPPNIREVLLKWLLGKDYRHSSRGFMGRAWDSFVPGPSLMREVYRVLKPGGFVLCFSSTRTDDLMSISLRLAGFEKRDIIEWLYASGHPKTLDVSKQIDKEAGALREKVGEFVHRRSGSGTWARERGGMYGPGEKIVAITKPSTESAKKWEGWNTGLKPAHEPIIMARKPLIGNVTHNVKTFGTGALNINACRIQGDDMSRYPANCITLDEDEWFSRYFNVSPKDISKKASQRDRNSDWLGNDIRDFGIENDHITVKPVALMEWLVRLCTQPGGVTLDPFCGSGSTLVGAARGDFNFVGIDMIDRHAKISTVRTKGYAEYKMQQPESGIAA